MNFRVAKRVLTASAIALAACVAAGPALASSSPSGETMLGQSAIEPAYNIDGSTIYLLTPIHPPINANSHNTAPLYVIMYPASAASSVGVMQCAHQPTDNCPDHGPLLAGLAESAVPSVYKGGVWGHDHLLAAPGSGGDFNIAWEPIAVLFTNSTAANTHITTLAQLKDAEGRGNAFEIPLPQATFHCSVVAAAVYNNGTPVTPAPGLP